MEKCVVIIPALNEEKTIGQVIDAVPILMRYMYVTLSAGIPIHRKQAGYYPGQECVNTQFT